jgi:hypothetical protein
VAFSFLLLWLSSFLDGAWSCQRRHQATHRYGLGGCARVRPGLGRGWGVGREGIDRAGAAGNSQGRR